MTTDARQTKTAFYDSRKDLAYQNACTIIRWDEQLPGSMKAEAVRTALDHVEIVRNICAKFIRQDRTHR